MLAFITGSKEAQINLPFHAQKQDRGQWFLSFIAKIVNIFKEHQVSVSTVEQRVEVADVISCIWKLRYLIYIPKEGNYCLSGFTQKEQIIYQTILEVHFLLRDSNSWLKGQVSLKFVFAISLVVLFLFFPGLKALQFVVCLFVCFLFIFGRQ